jgi:hypothetical protein
MSTKTPKLTQTAQQLAREIRRLEQQKKELLGDLEYLKQQVAEQTAGAKLAAQAPDLVGQVVAATRELVRRYFPSAYSAHLYIHEDHRPEGKYLPSATIPVELPDPAERTPASN